MAASRIDLINRALPKAFRGYACLEVDRLVQDLSDALARATDERMALAAKVKDLEAHLAEYKERETALQETFLAGRRISEEIRDAAQKEAQLVLETARVKADALLQNAQIRLTRVAEEAAAAQKTKVQFEMKLRSVIEEHLQLLDLNRKESAGLEALSQKMRPGGIAGYE